MNWDDTHLRRFAARMGRHIDACTGGRTTELIDFNELALELFALQFEHNAAYRKFCESRGAAEGTVQHWSEIPAIPTHAFKEWELSCIAADFRTAVFYSSGTTEQRPSRHFHNQDSLKLYECSLKRWFTARFPQSHRRESVIALTPGPEQAPHSSLVHMFSTLRRELGFARFSFTGETVPDGAWELGGERTVDLLREAESKNEPVLLLGTAFSYVHLLDFMGEQRLNLPAGSRLLETGGYKGRSRVLPKAELHRLVIERLHIPASEVICEYGMSELSSQAYDGMAGICTESHNRVLQFPPWAKVQIVSPETGQEVAEGQTGLIRMFDLANVYSVMAIETEDLAVHRGDGFELIGRAAQAEPRGCSLMASR